jgi:hypothetical protein
MRSSHYIAPINPAPLTGQVISLVNPLGKRGDHVVAEIAYSQLEDLYQGKTTENVIFSLSRVKMEQKFQQTKRARN